MKGSTEKVEAMKKAAMGVLLDEPNGITVRRIQKRLRIDGVAQSSQPEVWRLNSALASLTRDRFVTWRSDDGDLRYYPRHAD